MTQEDIVLAAMAAGGVNPKYGPAQIQKLMFLIDREIPQRIDGPHFDFEPYDYGPFDKAVYQVLDALKLGGLVEVECTGRYRHYALTQQGIEVGRRKLESLAPEAREYVEKAAAWILSVSFRQLVTAIYKHYPDMKVNSVFQE